MALTRELFGPELAKSRVLELNASDERGISIVREKIKNFAKISVSAPSEHAKKNYPCPPYKIIILDEADSMTHDAQSALRRTMETYSKITRFCLICNFVTRIIDPLASRCSKFRFKPLDQSSAIERLNDIAKTENVMLEGPEVIQALVKVSEGDLRKSITFLQSAARLHAPIPKPKKKGDEDEEMADADAPVQTPVTVRSIEEIAGVIPEDKVDALLECCKPKQRGSVYPGIAAIVEELVADGWSATQVVAQVSLLDTDIGRGEMLTAVDVSKGLI